MLLVSRGSDGNIDAPTAQISSGRSQIRAFSISALSNAPVDYTAGEVIGWGLRNSVGMGEDVSTGGFVSSIPRSSVDILTHINKWSVENSVDDMRRQGKDVHNTNPGEELNYHGLLFNDTKSPERGANFGYPQCFSAWDPSVLPANSNIKVGTQFLIVDASGSNTDAMCLQRQAPRLTFTSHTAPLDVKFNRNGTVAYIAFHGSW